MDADKLEEADERFCIMDSQSDVDQEYIFNYLARRYGDEITNYIKSKYARPVQAPSVENKGDILQATYRNTTDAEKATRNPAIDVLTLEKYINAGIKLIPTKPNQEGNFFQLKKNKGTDQEEIIKIDSLPGLQYWIEKDIERFIFIPKEAGFLCFDLDRNHGDGVDGVNNFYSWLKDNGLDQIPLFKDLDGGSFPTYTTTASGGLHLYFKCTADLKTFATIAPGVEIKYNGLNITAGGSVKNGKPYSLHGELNKAPTIPAPLLLRLSKVLSKEPPKQTARPYGNTPQAKEKKGFTSDQLLDFARQDSRGGNHDIILQMAGRLKRAGYSEADTIAIIEATPEHQGRKDKQDTFTCIKSIYR